MKNQTILSLCLVSFLFTSITNADTSYPSASEADLQAEKSIESSVAGTKRASNSELNEDEIRKEIERESEEQRAARVKRHLFDGKLKLSEEMRKEIGDRIAKLQAEENKEILKLREKLRKLQAQSKKRLARGQGKRKDFKTKLSEDENSEQKPTRNFKCSAIEENIMKCGKKLFILKEDYAATKGLLGQEQAECSMNRIDLSTNRTTPNKVIDMKSSIAKMKRFPSNSKQSE